MVTFQNSCIQQFFSYFQVDRSREAEGPYLENMVYGDHQ